MSLFVAKLGHLYDFDEAFMDKTFVAHWKNRYQPLTDRLWLIPSKLQIDSDSWKWSGVSVQVSLSDDLYTKSGAALLMDEYKIGQSRFYKILLSGEERFVSGILLYYATEIKG